MCWRTNWYAKQLPMALGWNTCPWMLPICDAV
jgi:hypothetical protein